MAALPPLGRGQSRRLHTRLFLGGAFLVLVALASLLPGLKGLFSTPPLLHDCAHAAAFLVAFLLLAWSESAIGRAARLCLLLLAFGIVLEVLETRAYGNRLEYRDIALDAAGLGIAFFIRLALWLQSSPQE